MRAAYMDMLGICQFYVLDAPFTQEYITAARKKHFGTEMCLSTHC